MLGKLESMISSSSADFATSRFITWECLDLGNSCQQLHWKLPEKT